MKLIIVESPTKAKTLKRFLGDGYDVEATVGHIKDLPKSPISVDIENNFEPDYQVVERQKKTITALKKAAKKADVVYLATDPDREGEAISAHVAEILKNGKIKRIVFHEITKSAVEHAMEKPRGIDEHLVDAQIARRVLDRLVGYKLSPILWKKVRRGLSAGRVQSVAVRLIVEKEREIEAFEPKEYWEIGSRVKSANDKGGQAGAEAGFVVDLSKIDGKKAEVPDKKTAEKIVGDLKKADHIVDDIVRREVKKKPYPPFTTSTLMRAGANVFGWSSKRTMSLAQRLYEQGLITYHRTDSLNISKNAIEASREHITKNYGKSYVPEKPRLYKTRSKGAQEAHEAIRPTDVSLDSIASLQNDKSKLDASANLPAQAGKLYKLVWSRFMASQMASAVFDRTTIKVVAGKYGLRTTGQVIKFDGWYRVSPPKKDEEPIIPSVKAREKLELLDVLSEQKFTSPPARYNEASLIKMLESLGIGRPSTYAPTISTIQIRNYVEKKDRAFHPTPIGVSVTDFLVKHFPDTFDYEFTADMEEKLDKVAEGKIDWQKDIKNFWEPFSKKLTDVEKNAERVKIPTEKLNEPCPRCAMDDEPLPDKGELIVRTGRFGKFISCSNFPLCDYTDKYQEKIDMKCPKCEEDDLPLSEQGDVVVKKTKKGRTFYGCSRYPDCDYASWKKPTDPNKPDQEDEE